MKLRELAHSRAGDKGNLVNISVIAYWELDYPTLVRVRHGRSCVSELFQEHIARPVVRYCVPNVFALNFVLSHLLGRQRHSRSLRLDMRMRKSLSSLMLSLEI